MSSTPAGNNNNEDSRLLIPATPNPEEEERETHTHTQTSRRFQTLLDLLTSDKPNGPDRTSTRRQGLFTLLGCCGSATWRRRSSPSPPPENGVVVIENPGGGMNLAEALAAEREFREEETTRPEPESERVSLLRLLERETEEREEGMVGNDRVCCCVCMVREKGAAMIPCGHTFCRICSKEVWVNRGSCPLCNRLILDILNIF